MCTRVRYSEIGIPVYPTSNIPSTVRGFLYATPLAATIFGTNYLLEGGKEQTTRRQNGACSKFKTRRCLAYTYPGPGCRAHAMTFAIQIVHFYYHFNSRALGHATRVLPPRRRCTGGQRARTHAPESIPDIVPAKRVTAQWEKPMAMRSASIFHAGGITASTLRHATSANREPSLQHIAQCDILFYLFLIKRRNGDLYRRELIDAHCEFKSIMRCLVCEW